MLAWLSLFAASFLAATVLPLSSEAVLLVMLSQGASPLWLLVVASVGNTLGSTFNWVLGRFLLRYRDRPWFYFNDQQIDKAQRWFQRRGQWSLLLAWLPIGGDALTFIAGVMHMRLPLFLLLVGTGKTFRYAAVILSAETLHAAMH